VAARAADLPASPACAGAAGKCEVSAKDLKQAREVFARGLKLQNSGKKEEAFEAFERASNLAPKSFEYLTAREVMRQQLVLDHLQRGNSALQAGRQVEALAEFRAALHLDSSNEFALQRLHDALAEWAPAQPVARARVLAAAGEIHVEPQPVRHDFSIRGDSRTLLEQVANAYGMTSVIDESVLSRRVRFDIDNVDFFTAMQAAGRVTKTFWAPVSEKQIIIAADTPENHRQYDRMALRTIYVPDATTPQQLNDVANLLRSLFEIRFLNQQPSTSTITVRAPQRMLDAATRLLEGLDSARPQIMLDVKVYEINHTMTRSMGIDTPAQFQMFNIPVGALAALGRQNIQDLINQLIANGGINQANSQALSALLAQLQNQAGSLFSQPVATFGGGSTLTGLTIPQVTATLSLNESAVNTLEHATLHAAHGDTATFRVGSRYPILNASFAPIFNTPAITQVIANNSFASPFPSFNYEDLGLTLKAKPAVHGDASVGLDLELQLRTLQGQSINGVPIISERDYKGMINVKDGEPAVIAGTVSNSEQISLRGLPGIGQLPGLNKVGASNNKQVTEDELLLVITPHLVKGPSTAGTEVWLAK
jgi:general secretion pathway protein D